MFGFKKAVDADVIVTQPKKKKKLLWAIGGLIGIYLLVCIVIGIYWSTEPDMFSVEENAKQAAIALENIKPRPAWLPSDFNPNQLPVGFTTIETLKRIASTLVNKSGGFLTNDVFPPGLWLDNIPSWEIGVLKQVRDMSLTLQRSFSRSQSQSSENTNLAKAFEFFSAEPSSWLFPAAEQRYTEAVSYLNAYERQLFDPKNSNAKFYPRADNLASWLALVETQLGSLSQRLASSVGQQDIVLLGANTANIMSDKDKKIKTSWFQIDNVFYEARGQAWALALLLRAIEVDFQDVLVKKGAQTSVRQIIRDLEATQQPVWSPIILNGSGFGFLANHSLVMASYISRANAAVIDLRRLLEQG